MGRLDGKVAIVTGGARGIGEATVRLFVAEGAKVVVADVLEAEGAALAASLGDAAHFVRHDVTDAGRWAEVVRITEERFGKLDILVNNAGILMMKGLFDHSPDDIRRIIDINLTGTIFGTQAAAAAMRKNGSGSIVNISSADGLTGANAVTAYTASKWGVRGFTKAAAMELGPEGIRVNSIHPGGVDTVMTGAGLRTREQFDASFRVYPAQRACDPVDIAHGILYFASAEGRYCMGAELAIDGGLTAGHYYSGLPGAPRA